MKSQKQPDSSTHRKLILAGVCLALFVPAAFFVIKNQIQNGTTETRNVADAQTRFPLRLNNGKTIRVRLALTDLERMRGLMGCRSLDEDEGMLFVYPTAEQRAFWMKNVPIDLDIGYFDSEGKLLEVYTMRAHDTTSVYSKSEDICFCLEMNRAWFKKNKALPENNVFFDTEIIRRAMRKRGFQPAF